MNNKSLEFLEKLIDSMSPSGYEDEAAEVWQKEAHTFTKDVHYDVHGNSDVVINPGGYPRIMFTGHYDEIGFLITHIDSRGFLWLEPIGGWDPQIPQGQRVIIRGTKGRVPGVMGKCPIHLIKQEDRDKVVKLEKLWVDIGVSNQKEAEKLVSIGDPLVLDHRMAHLQGDIVVGRGFDNRIGAFIVLEAARLLAKRKIRAEVHAVATVQEELGLRGARTAAFGIDPQIGIATDVDFATDYPGMEEHIKREGDIHLGKGPVITRGPNIHPVLFEMLTDTAKKKKVACQVHAQGTATGTDANVIQINRAGVVTGLVSVPNRYMHSSCEMLHLKDVEACIELLAAVAERITPETDFTIRSKKKH